MAEPAILPTEPFQIIKEDENGQRPMSDAEVVSYVQSTLSAEHNNRLEKEGIWNDGIDLLMNRHDFSGKESWQAQIVVSKIPNAINAGLAILKSAITQTKDWFDLTGADAEDKALAGPFKKLFRAQIEERDLVTHRDVLDEWVLGLKHAMATSIIVMKVLPRAEKRRVRVFEAGNRPDQAQDDPAAALAALSGQAGVNPVTAALNSGETLNVQTRMVTKTHHTVRAELVDPFDYYGDTTQRGKYEMQKIRGDLDDLERLPAASGYHKEALAQVKARVGSKSTADTKTTADASRTTGSGAQDEQDQRIRVGEGTEQAANRRSWEGIEFWGDIPSPDGSVVFRDHQATVIEGTLVQLRRNPFDDGRPFRKGEVEPIAFSTYGRGLVENVGGLARVITELTNAILDSAIYEILKAWEVDLAVSAHPNQFAEGVSPGRVFYKDTTDMPADRQMVRALDTGQMSAAALAMLVQVDRDFQEGSNVTDLSQGLSPTGGEATATEINDRRQSSSIVFRSIAQWLEKTHLEPLLSAIFNRMVQFRLFGPGGEEWAKQVLGPVEWQAFSQRLQQRLLSGNGRFELDVDFKVTALSSILARQAELDRLSRLLEAIKGFPGIANRLNLGGVSAKVIEALGYGSEDLLRPEQELQLVQQIEDRMLMQAAQQINEQPRSHAGPGQAAAAAVAPSGT